MRAFKLLFTAAIWADSRPARTMTVPMIHFVSVLMPATLR